MDESWDFVKETSSRFHRELDLVKLRTIHETVANDPGAYVASLPAEEQTEIRASFEENARAIDAVIARERDLPGEAVPCDVIQFVDGEAPDRAMTKLGGLPYWPASRRWPTNWRGKPLSFLGQINFRDSRDIIGDTPGEILVMFVNQWDWVRSYWLTPTDEPLVKADTIPECERHFGNCYGVIHRTYDVPGRTLSDEAGVRNDVESMLFDLKIGGIPWGHHVRSSGKSFLFQLMPPHEVKTCADGTEYALGWVSAECRDVRWPWAKDVGDAPVTYSLDWWAASLKRNGKLSWSWV